jgi:hypothetical protein
MLAYPGYRPTKVDVRIGVFAGVDSDSLSFCFEAIVKDSPPPRLELVILPGAGDELDLGSIELEERKDEVTA